MFEPQKLLPPMVISASNSTEDLSNYFYGNATVKWYRTIDGEYKFLVIYLFKVYGKLLQTITFIIITNSKNNIKKNNIVIFNYLNLSVK